MRHLKTEKGYALVLALLIIVVFMVIALFLMGRSYTSVKQNTVVEKNYQSVALAEMGVSYLQMAVKNAFDTHKSEVLDVVKKEINKDEKNKTIRPKGYYSSLTLSTMAERIETSVRNDLDKDLKMEMDKDGSSYFRINQDPLFIAGSNDIQISFSSIGVEDNEEAELSAEMVIPMEAFKDGGTGDNEGAGKPLFNQIDEPDADCVNPNKIEDCSKVLLTNETSDYTKNFNKAENEVIYAKGHLNIGGNGNKAEIQDLHVEGNLHVGGNMNQSSSKMIEVKGDAILSGQFRTEGSDVYVGKNLEIHGHLELDTEAFMYVAGNATLSKHLTISPDSKMCVAGELTVTGAQINVNNNLFINRNGGVDHTGKGKYLEEAEFNEVCGLTQFDSPLTIEWGKIENKVKYTY
jgi:hypothetical protein